MKIDNLNTVMCETGHYLMEKKREDVFIGINWTHLIQDRIR